MTEIKLSQWMILPNGTPINRSGLKYSLYMSQWMILPNGTPIRR